MARLSKQDAPDATESISPQRQRRAGVRRPFHCGDTDRIKSLESGKTLRSKGSWELNPANFSTTTPNEACSRARDSAKAQQQIRTRRCLKLLDDNSALLQSTFKAEPRRQAKRTVALTIVQSPEQASESFSKLDLQRPLKLAEPANVPVFDLHDVQRSQKEPYTLQIQQLVKLDSEPDEEDDMPIKPSRTPRPLSKAKKQLDLLESLDEDLMRPLSDREPQSEFLNDSLSESHAVLPSEELENARPLPTANTPPASPSKSRLKSPSKTVKNIPSAPHNRPSLDAFWSVDEVNSWNDQHSPKKVLRSPRKNPLFLFAQPTPRHLLATDWSDQEYESEREYIPLYKKSTEAFPHPTSLSQEKPKISKASKEASADVRVATRKLARAKKQFDASKHEIASGFLTDLDNTITKGEIGRLTASTGGVKIIWSKKLNSTAGRAHWKRERVQATNSTSSATDAPIEQHIASIEIAEKVIDDEDRLRNVLAHEFCHLTNFMISKMTKEPHGASFKVWAAKVTSSFAHMGVEVTTKHSYEISYKYAWVCAGNNSSRGPPGPGGVGLWDDDGCGTTYQRHSKSIDPARQRCGKCKGTLEQVRPVPRGASAAQVSQTSTDQGEKPHGKEEITTTKAKSAYQAFVSQQYKIVKAELGLSSPMKEVMGEIGRRYRAQKQDPAPKPNPKKVVNLVDLDDSSARDSKLDVRVDEVARKLDFLEL